MSELRELKFQQNYLKILLAKVESKIFNIERAEREKIIAACSHNMVYAGHGHNDDYYKCSKCGYGEWQ